MEQTRRPGMDRDSGEIVLSQDKAVPQLSRNSPNSRHEVCGNALRRCGRSAGRRGPVLAVVFSVLRSAAGARQSFGSEPARGVPQALWESAGDGARLLPLALQNVG